MPISAKDWYEPNPDHSSFYQGDVVRNVPVLFLPDNISKWLLLRPDPRSTKYHVDEVLGGQICRWLEAFTEAHLSDAWQHGKREELVAAKARLMDVVILTQSCDIVQRSYYQIAPLYPESVQKDTAIPRLRENQLNYTFFLPALAPHIPENSYADLSQTTFIPKAYFPKNKVAEILSARLTEDARTLLQEQVAYYFGRPFGFGERDRAKKTAEYACVSCFYKTAASTKKNFDLDQHFTKCEVCGEARWLRIVPHGETALPQTEPVIRSES
jgi:hypothetical protein